MVLLALAACGSPSEEPITGGLATGRCSVKRGRCAWPVAVVEPTLVSSGLVAHFDADNEVNGDFTVYVCP